MNKARIMENIQDYPPTVRWTLHAALKNGDRTAGTIHEPGSEYENVDEKQIEFFLEQPPSGNDETPVLITTTTCFTPLALQEPVQQQVESSAALKRPLSSNTSDSSVVVMEIQPTIIGSGSFGACYQAIVKDYSNGQFEIPQNEVAFKQMNMEGFGSSQEVYRHEAAMLRKLNQHENIVKHLFSCTCKCISSEEKEGQTQTYTQQFAGIAMELCSGTTLHKFLKSKMKKHVIDQPHELIPLEELIQIFRQSADGLQYMKDSQIIHCDIKLDNLIWDERLQILKFIDFGLAFYKKCPDKVYTCRGTSGYIAPECYDKKVDFYSDIWSLGIMMSCLILQLWPYGTNPNMVKLNNYAERGKKDLQKRRKAIIQNEIEDLKRSKTNMTTIEKRLRESYTEVDSFCKAYKPESLIKSDAFKSFASRVADTLSRDGIRRPTPQALMKDCKIWLEEIKEQEESISSFEAPQRVEEETDDSTVSGSKGIPDFTLLKQSTALLKTEPNTVKQDAGAGEDKQPVVPEPPDEGPPAGGPSAEGPSAEGPPTNEPAGEGPSDEGPPEVGPPDEGPPDERPPDEGSPDEGSPDEGSPDESPPDEGSPDKGPPAKRPRHSIT